MSRRSMTAKAASSQQQAAVLLDLPGEAHLALARAVGELILRTGAELDAILQRCATRSGLTPMELRALRACLGGARQAAIAATLGCDAARVSHLVDQLERRGMAKRVALESDRRIARVEPTSQGLDVIAQVQATLVKESPLINRTDQVSLTKLFELLAPLAGEG